MDTLIGQFSREPVRHGDTLDNKSAPDIRVILGDETTRKVASACRYMEIQTQIRNEPKASKFFASMAQIFQT